MAAGHRAVGLRLGWPVARFRFPSDTLIGDQVERPSSAGPTAPAGVDVQGGDPAELTH